MWPPGRAPGFQHTAARRRLPAPSHVLYPTVVFQHTAARRRLLACIHRPLTDGQFQHTAARRRLRPVRRKRRAGRPVSTHSRPKAAATLDAFAAAAIAVSTHSRPKAAAEVAAKDDFLNMFQHTAARRRLPGAGSEPHLASWFQHTAARRRLRPRVLGGIGHGLVSTHSRPKAAARPAPCRRPARSRFNTQPPEGGCMTMSEWEELISAVSTHSRPKAAAQPTPRPPPPRRFQHTAARRRLHG